MIPVINGNLEILVDSYANLICFVPECLSRRGPLTYTWFINDTKMEGETKEGLRVHVTRDEKYNNYSCTAAKHRLKTSRSNSVQINPLCKLHIYLIPIFVSIHVCLILSGLHRFCFLLLPSKLEKRNYHTVPKRKNNCFGCFYHLGYLGNGCCNICWSVFYKKGTKRKKSRKCTW